MGFAKIRFKKTSPPGPYVLQSTAVPVIVLPVHQVGAPKHATRILKIEGQKPWRIMRRIEKACGHEP